MVRKERYNKVTNQIQESESFLILKLKVCNKNKKPLSNQGFDSGFTD